MKYLFVILAWVMGLLLIFLGLIFMVKTPFAGGLLMLLSLFLLPPVRHYIHIKTNKKISILLISVSIFCLTVLILVLITNERKAAKLKAFTEFSIKDQIIQEEFAKRSKAKALAEVNKTVSLDIENKNNEKSPELAVKKTGSRQVSMSTLNTVISLTNDISLNWDHDVLKKYIESENFIKNEISYQKLFDKHANLGKLKTCSNLGLLGYEQESLFTIKQDCEFENGNAYIQAIFQEKATDSQLMALTIKELISEQKIFCGILAQEGNQFYVKSNTLTIPFFNEEESPDFAFGCIINKSGKFQAHYIIESSKRLMNNLSVTNIHLPALEWKIIETPKYHFVDQTHIAITLDNSDVPGPYEIKLFIDNKLSKQVTFIIQ